MEALGLVPAMVDADGALVTWPGSAFDLGKFDAEAITDLDWV